MSDGIELAQAFVTVIPSMKGAQGTIRKELGGALDEGAQDAADSAGDKAGAGLGKKLALTAGAAFAALGVGAILADAIGQSMDMEKANAKLTASMNLTAEESQKAGAIAGSLWSQAYGESASDVSDAVGSVMSSIKGMRNASQPEIEAMSKHVMSLAEAFDMDVGEAAQAAGQLVQSGLAKNGTEAVDLLAASLSKVPAAMRGDLVDAANEYGGYLKDLGMNGEQAMSALVAASGGGTIAIDKTGDALKELSIRATDMSKTSVDAYKSAGLNAEDMASRFLKGGDTAKGAMSDLVQGLQGIKDPTKQANAAIALFGTPLEDIGVNKIPEFLKGLSGMDTSLGDVSGAAANLDGQLNNNTATSLEAVQRGFQSVVVEGVKPLLGVVKPMLDWLLQNPVLMQTLVIGLGAFAIALGVAAAAQWVMNAALLANPITWIVLGVVALIAALVLLIANWEAVAAFLGSVWQACVEGVVAGWNWVSAQAGAIWGAIASFFTGLWSKITSGISGAWNGIKAWLSGLWTGIKAKATEIWNGLVSWITGIPGRILGGLNALGQLAGRAAQWFLGFVNAGKTKLGDLINWVRGVPGRILSALGNIGGMLVNSGRSLVDGFLSGIQGAWGNLTSWVSQGMANLRGLWPFSPAKWGPFAGHGYVTYSGQALTEDFAASLRDGQDTVARAAEGVLASASSGLSWTGTVNAVDPAPAQAGTTVNIDRVINPIAEPLTVSTNRQLQVAAALAAGMV